MELQRARACDRKKNYKKDLQSSVNRDIIESNKEAAISGKGGYNMPAVFNNVFNKAKVRSWIKKTRKSSSFGYGHGYVTDGYAMLVDEPHMHPTILEIFGTLTPECRYSAEQFERLMKLPNEPIQVFDSQLELILEPTHRLHIFYNPKTGKELAVNSIYFDLLENPRAYRYYTNELMSMLWIICGNETVGVIAPYRLQDQLSHVRFKAEEEREQV